MKPCKHCGAPIQPKVGCYQIRRYCSARCYHEAGAKRNRERHQADKAAK